MMEIVVGDSPIAFNFLVMTPFAELFKSAFSFQFKEEAEKLRELGDCGEEYKVEIIDSDHPPIILLTKSEGDYRGRVILSGGVQSHDRVMNMQDGILGLAENVYAEIKGIDLGIEPH